MNKRDIFRYGFVFLTFLGTFSSYPQAVYQARAEEPNNGIISITTAQEFQDINLDLTAHYEIANDIDFTGFVLSPLAPLSSEPFTGTIDGNDFTLSNILIDLPTTISSRYAYVALLIHNNGTIRDLNLLNVKFEATQASPALVSTPPEPSGYAATYYFSHFLYQNQADGVLENISLRLTVDASIALTLVPSFTEVAHTGIYNTLFVHQNLGSISDIDFALTASYQFGFLANDYYFSFIFENDGDVSRVNLRYVPNLFSWKAEDQLNLSFFVYQNFGNASLIKLFIVSDANFVVRNGDALDTTISNLAILNAGLLDQVYLYTDYTMVFDGVNLVRYAGVVDWNQTDGGVLSNLYANTNVSLVFFNFNDNPNPTLNTQDYFISGLINRNEGTLRYFYQVGSFNLFFQYVHEVTQTNASLARISNGSIDVPGLIEYGISSLALKVISLATEDNFLVIDTFSNSAPGSPFQVFSTLDKVTFLKLNEAFVSAYTVETDGVTEVNTYIAQSDTFAFNEAHYLPVVAFDITNQTNYSALTTKALFTNIFSTNTNWTKTQVSIHDSWVLSHVNKLTFNVPNYSIQTIGASYVVTSGVDVFLDEVKLNDGTYYFTETGAYVFALTQPDFGIENNVSILVFTENHNLNSSGATFTGSFTPSFGEGMTATLNGNAYVLGTVINEPGDHTLVVSGENGYSATYTFTIDLVVTGVVDLGSYTSGISPTFSGGTATLNGQAYTSGTSISNVGNYSLVITGRPGFTRTYSFSIGPSTTNLISNQTYDPNFVPNLVGQGMTVTLNGDAYVVGTAIQQPGNHSLVITGANGYTTTYNFTIDLEVSGFINGSTNTTSVTPVFSGGTATLNGESFISNTTISKIGNHTLIITGRPGFIRTFTFTIVSTSTNFTNGDSKAPDFIPTFFGEGMTITLNNNPYELGTVINLPGDHTLVVSGVNGYSKTYNFSIALVVTGVAHLENYTSARTPFFSGGTATLNGQPYSSGTIIPNIGTYHLVITGRPGFTATYTFNIGPVTSNLVNNRIYNPNFIPNLVGGGMTLTLNDQPYSLGTSINEPGEHTLVIYGVNGFSTSYSFSIDLIVSGVVNLGNYTSTRTPIISGGTATLNGAPFSSGTLIPNVGSYRLDITGRPGFLRTFIFSIGPSSNNLINNRTYDPNFVPNLVGQGMTLRLNGVTYIQGTPINQPGFHTLVVSGLNNYAKTYVFNIELVMSGFVNETTYTTTVTPVFSGGTATLNGEPHLSNTAVNDVGNHILIVQGTSEFTRTFTFTIAHTTNNLINDQTFDPNFTPNLVGQGMIVTLNDDPYALGTPINEPGDHILLVNGVNDYVVSYNFSIDLIVTGFIDGTTYTTAVTPVFSGGVATLNGLQFISERSINRIGNHVLIITGRPGFTRTFNFTIASTSLNIVNGDLEGPNFVPTFFGQGMTLSLNGESYELGDRISEPGDHTLVVFGVNGYSLSYNFSIELVVTGFVDGGTYPNSIKPVFSGGTATLNNVTFISNTETKLIGNYDLVISGRPGFTQTFRFTIEPHFYYEDGEVLYAPVVIDYPNATEVRINGKIHTKSYRIEIQRAYEIEIDGVNGYSLAFTVLFKNPNLTDVQTLIAPLAMTAIATIGMYFLRRRWVK